VTAAASTERLDEHAFLTALPDGPTILSERMESIHSLSIGFWFRQGRLHEPGDLLGASHLLEHMVFKGTERRSARDIAWEIERVGGVIDAYTTHETTSYQARVPAEYMDLAIDVLSDIVFHPALRSSDLELERQVVLEEIAEIEEAPEEVAFEAHASFLYGGHPYGEPITGTLESVAQIGRDDLERLHAAAYLPSNLVIAAVGAVDHEELVETVSRRLPARVAEASTAAVSAVGAGSGLRHVSRPGGRQTHILAGALTVPYRDPRRYAVVVTSTALGAGMSSRLFQRIREELGLAYSVYSFHCFFASAGHLGAYVGTRPEVADRAREVLTSELSALAREGLRPAELEDTRTQLKGQITISLESPATRMNRLAGVALLDQPFRSVAEVAARIDAVDEEQCAEVSAMFAPDRSAFLVLSPEEEVTAMTNANVTNEPLTQERSE
jgi:predicted Zn-dependent peptidase